jgi:DNA polymerase-3 subunit beta
MKFTCTQENLSRGLSAVSRVASKSAVLAVLNNVLLIAEDGRVQLQTTNLELAVTITIRAKVEVPGRYTVPSRLLSDFITLLGNEKVELEATPAGLRVVSGHTHTTIKGSPADDFPVLPTHETATEVTLPSNVLRQALEETVFAAANDESRPEISGVYCAVEDKQLILTATDSYRLAESSCKLLTAANEARQAILPARTAQEVLRLLPDNETVVKFMLGDDQARLLVEDIEILSRVIEGQYPDYKQIIPTSWNTKVVCDTENLLANIRAASLFCKAGIHDLTLHIQASDNAITLSAANTQLGEHEASVDAAIEGQDQQIIFNYRYLIDGITTLGGTSTTIEIQDHNTAAILRNPEKSNTLYLLMPIRQ